LAEIMFMDIFLTRYPLDMFNTKLKYLANCWGRGTRRWCARVRENLIGLTKASVAQGQRDSGADSITRKSVAQVGKVV
jgi:hypothetical protein